jgi:methoxymalonate biosynthesis acyl carrier protein
MSNTIDPSQGQADSVHAALTTFLEARTKTVWKSDTDLFATGAVSSLFAMELVVHIEQSFGVTIEGDDLRMDNFRTIGDMAEMVGRLKSAANHA